MTLSILELDKGRDNHLFSGVFSCTCLYLQYEGVFTTLRVHSCFFEEEGTRDLIKVIVYFIEQKIQRFLCIYP